MSLSEKQQEWLKEWGTLLVILGLVAVGLGYCWHLYGDLPDDVQARAHASEFLPKPKDYDWVESGWSPDNHDGGRRFIFIGKLPPEDPDGIYTPESYPTYWMALITVFSDFKDTDVIIKPIDSSMYHDAHPSRRR